MSETSNDKLSTRDALKLVADETDRSRQKVALSSRDSSLGLRFDKVLRYIFRSGVPEKNGEAQSASQ